MAGEFNTERLRLKLIEVGVDPRRYFIGGFAGDALCIAPRDDGQWEIFSVDRSEKVGVSVWPNEESACLGFLGRLARSFWRP